MTRASSDNSNSSSENNNDQQSPSMADASPDSFDAAAATTAPTSLRRRSTVLDLVESEEQAATMQRQVTQSSPGMAVAGEHVMELEFEEWDGSTPFYQHCLAGSLAGVAEHRKYCSYYIVEATLTDCLRGGKSDLPNASPLFFHY